MNLKFLLFIFTFVTVLALSICYAFVRITTNFAWAKAHPYIVILGFTLFLALQFAEPVFYRSRFGNSSKLIPFHFFNYLLLGVFTTFVFYIFLGDITYFAALAAKIKISDPLLFCLVCSATVISVAIGIKQAVTSPKIYNVEVGIKNLPNEFKGFKIAQISDLHVGPTISKAFAEKVVNTVNQLNADAVVLTGDLIDGYVYQLSDAVAPLGNLNAQYKLFVTGNHEYYWHGLEWIKKMRELGITPLTNEHLIVDCAEQKLVFAGIPDISAHNFVAEHKIDFARTLKDAPLHAPKILLAHQPVVYKQAAQYGFDLQLSGHTHGGQFFPLSLLVRAVQRFYKGLSRYKNMWIYVNRGTGYWGPPLRFLVPGEITLITLK